MAKRSMKSFVSQNT